MGEPIKTPTLDVILAWFQDLPPGARAKLSLHNLHTLAKALAAAPSPVVEGGDQGSKSCAFQLASGNSPSPSTDGPAGTWRAVGRVTLSHIPSGARYTFWDGQTIKAVEPASAEAAERLSAILAGKDPDDAQGVTGGAEPCPACLGEAEGCGVCNERGAA